MIKTQLKAWQPNEQELDALKQKIDQNLEMLQPTYKPFGKLQLGKGKKANIRIPMPTDKDKFEKLRCKICREIPLEKFYTCTQETNKSNDSGGEKTYCDYFVC